MNSVGKRVAFARDKASLNQSELARRIGVKPQTIQQIESGETKRSRYLPDIAKETRVSIEWLTTGHGDTYPGKMEVREEPGDYKTINPVKKNVILKQWKLLTVEQQNTMLIAITALANSNKRDN